MVIEKELPPEAVEGEQLFDAVPNSNESTEPLEFVASTSSTLLKLPIRKKVVWLPWRKIFTSILKIFYSKGIS